MSRVLNVPVEDLRQAAIAAASFTVDLMEYGPARLYVAWTRQDIPPSERAAMAEQLVVLAEAERAAVDELLPRQRIGDSLQQADDVARAIGETSEASSDRGRD